MRIAVATCLELPEPDVDEPILMAALADAGIDATLAAWDDPSARWEDFDLCIVRSTWNYPEAPHAFQTWVRSTGMRVPMLNPPEVMVSNVDKRYLVDLRAKGINTVPTQHVRRNDGRADFSSWQGRSFVVKPAISAGSWMTRKFGPGEFVPGMAFLHGHASDRDMMVQPYLDSVERGGEVAWIWIDGEVTHGVRKSPRFEDGEESVSEAVQPTQVDRQRVDEILTKVDSELLYARIDLIESEGEMLLSELELIEPSLFFKQNPKALERFVDGVKRRIS